MRTILCVFLLTIFASCNKTSKTASTTKGSINAEAPYLWLNPNFPKSLAVSNAFLASEITSTHAMGDAWSTALENKVDFFNYATTTEKTVGLTNPGTLSDGILGVYKAETWIYPDYPDALAVTQIFAIRYNRGTPDEFVAIEEADIIMNYQNFEFDDPAISYDYDFQTVMLHEMGHFLGLGHKARTSPRAESVMYPSIYYYEVKQVPQLVDIGDLSSKYKITLTGSSSPASSGSLPDYQANGSGEPVKIILELKADGECVHHEDGAVVLRHHVKLK